MKETCAFEILFVVFLRSTFPTNLLCFWEAKSQWARFSVKTSRVTFGGLMLFCWANQDTVSPSIAPQKASVSWNDSPEVDAVLEEGCGFDSDDKDLSSNDENCKQQADKTKKRDAWKH